MSLTVAGVLGHPSLSVARPRLAAGVAGLDRRVRWIHSSEVLEIAPLLQGGELLLTGGQVLAGVDRAAQERYVRDLSQRRVAGVAIETGPLLPRLPDPMLRVADELAFPVVELRAVVPFVGVAEAINAELVNESVTMLRFGGELAHAFSLILGRGDGVQPLLDELAARTHTTVELVDTAGVTAASARPVSGVVDVDAHPDGTAAVTTRIAVRGVSLGTVTLRPTPGTDHEMLATAADRAAEALGLALVRTSAPSPRDVAGAELARSAHRTDLLPRLHRLAATAGIKSDAPVVAVVLEGWRQGRAGETGIDQVLGRYGIVVVDAYDAGVRAVVALPDRRHAEHARGRLLAEVRSWATELELAVCVGPAVAGVDDLPTSMRMAVAGLRSATSYGGVIDAATTMLVDWLGSEDQRSAAAEFVRGQLAMVLTLAPTEGSSVMETLEAYLDAGCSKTRAAAALHLRRQSLYARLDKAFTVIGGDPTGTARALPLHLALKLRHAMQLGGAVR